jgi:hypothetical protein
LISEVESRKLVTKGWKGEGRWEGEKKFNEYRDAVRKEG